MGRPSMCAFCQELIKSESPIIVPKLGKAHTQQISRVHAKCQTAYMDLIKKELEVKYNAQKEKESIKSEQSQKKQKELEWGQEERKKLDEVYLICKKLMGYEHKLSKAQVNRLLSLRKGNIVSRGSKMKDNQEGYPYEVIHLTLIYKKKDIEIAFSEKTFTSENGKFAYLMAILENSINDVYTRWENAKNHEKRIDELQQAIIKEEENRQEICTYKRDDSGDFYAESELFADLW